MENNNPLISALNNSVASNNASTINPYALMARASKSNPEVAQVLTALQRGRNPQELFYSLCKMKGVNPEAILGSLKG